MCSSLSQENSPFPSTSHIIWHSVVLPYNGSKLMLCRCFNRNSAADFPIKESSLPSNLSSIRFMPIWWWHRKGKRVCHGWQNTLCKCSYVLPPSSWTEGMGLPPFSIRFTEQKIRKNLLLWLSPLHNRSRWLTFKAEFLKSSQWRS